MSAHAAGLVRATSSTAIKQTSSPCLYSTFVITLLVLLSSGGGAAAEKATAVSAADSLLRFKAAMSNTKALSNWNASVPPCSGGHANWVGLSCSKGTVRGLVLERMNLRGSIDIDALLPLVNLRTISLQNNNFIGPIPPFHKLGPLKALFLSNNQFSGDIPDDAFSDMGSLKKLYLSHNNFTGEIPSCVATLPRLMELRLDDNKFQGRIPDFTRARSKRLRIFNVSRNQLEGPIPQALADKAASAFEGNDDLCGEPLFNSCDKTNYVFKFTIGVMMGAFVMAIVALCLILIIRRRRKRRKGAESEGPRGLARQARSGATYQNPNHVQHTSRALEKAGSMNGRLSFIRNGKGKFDLQDLLRAAAEVLGNGTFGSSYMTVVANGQAVVVKRYKYLNYGSKDEFNDNMRQLAKLDHPNLLPLVAYYYRKEEKLLICDFIPNGSLASHLHRNRGDEVAGLDWGRRLKIVKGVVEGLKYLHGELGTSHTVPHGHIKSSNVLLDKSLDPILTDYGLLPIMSPEHASRLMVAYKCPEYAHTSHLDGKADVWSLGILILEILTGKLPEHDTSADLATWVKEKKTGEAFDPEMEEGDKCKGEMKKLLKIGLSCCEEEPEMRMELREVLDKLEELMDADNSPYSTDVIANESTRLLTEM